MTVLVQAILTVSALTMILLLVVIIGALEQVIQLLTYEESEDDGNGKGYRYTIDPDSGPDKDALDLPSPELDERAREFYRLIHSRD